MSLSIFTLAGGMMLLRWLHYLAGVLWIGLLYYFNFVQGSFMAEADAATKSQVTQKLLPRALFWFRWGAMYTFISGLLILMGVAHSGGAGIIHSSWFVGITVGSTLGTLMFLNVWLVIWPNQKVVIANATAVAQGGQANPAAAASAARALMASRTNAMFSIPMLFFMGSASHLGLNVSSEANLMIPFGIIGLILAALEFNAVKGTKLGFLTTIKGFVHAGLGLAVVLYLILEFTLK